MMMKTVCEKNDKLRFSRSLSLCSYLEIGAELITDGVVVGVSQIFVRLNLLCTKTTETINTVEKIAANPTAKPMTVSSNRKICSLWLAPKEQQHRVTYSSYASVECLRIPIRNIRKYYRFLLSFSPRVEKKRENSWINK
jgi:hypothetical protein